MKRRNTITLLILLIILSPHFLYGDQKGSVLFISSYHPGFSTFFQQVEGLKDVLSQDSIQLEVEFMDTKRLPEAENFRLFRQYLEYKLVNTGPYDLIVTGDDNALTFAEGEKDRLFKGMPIVFLGVNNVEKALAMNDIPQITGIIEKVSLEETIELMLRQNVNASSVSVIVDSTPSGQGDLKSFWSLKEQFPHTTFLNLDLQKYNWEEFSRLLNSLNDQTSVLLLSAYSDKEGISLDFYESLDIITSSLKIPAYHLWEHGIGQGLLGGKVISHFEQGRTAGEIARKIIRGEKIAQIPVLEKSPNTFLIDYNQIKKHRIPEDTIPGLARVINQPYSFYRENSRIILFIASMLLFLMLTISFLLYVIFLLKQTEYSLKKQNEKNSILLTAVEQFDDTVEIFDMNQKTTYVNSAFLKLHGLKKEEVLGKTSVEIFTNAPEENYINSDSLWKTVELGKTGRSQMINEKKDGSKLVQEVSFTPVFGDDGTIIAYSSVKKDISGFYRLMEERNSLQEHMFKAQKLESVGQLASGIAHDFNNLLSGIMTSSQMILMHSSDKDEKIRKYGEMIHSSCKRGAGIIEKLMAFNQSRKSSPKAVNIETLVMDTIEILHHTIKKSIQLEFENLMSRNELICDTYSLQNALMNMGINSGQAIENRGSISFTLSERELDEEYCAKSDYEITPGVYCSIAVKDTGTGISNYVKTKIFDPFYTTKNDKESTGLGLSSVKRIVEEHKGCIELETEVGEWSCFTLLIPFKTD